MQYYLNKTYSIDLFNKGKLFPVSNEFGSYFNIPLNHGYPENLYRQILQQPGGKYLFEDITITENDIINLQPIGFIFTMLCKKLSKDKLVKNISFFDNSYYLFYQRVSLTELLLVYGINFHDYTHLFEMANLSFFKESIYDMFR